MSRWCKSKFLDSITWCYPSMRPTLEWKLFQRGWCSCHDKISCDFDYVVFLFCTYWISDKIFCSMAAMLLLAVILLFSFSLGAKLRLNKNRYFPTNLHRSAIQNGRMIDQDSSGSYGKQYWECTRVYNPICCEKNDALFTAPNGCACTSQGGQILGNPYQCSDYTPW